jgi:hypothetical protein
MPGAESSARSPFVIALGGFLGRRKVSGVKIEAHPGGHLRLKFRIADDEDSAYCDTLSIGNAQILHEQVIGIDVDVLG